MQSFFSGEILACSGDLVVSSYIRFARGSENLIEFPNKADAHFGCLYRSTVLNLTIAAVKLMKAYTVGNFRNRRNIFNVSILVALGVVSPVLLCFCCPIK